MPSGDPFTDTQVREISRAVRTASQDTGLLFSVFIGSADGGSRSYAERLHAALGDTAARAVLILVEPGERKLEIVTGRDCSTRLNDRTCGLAALSMTTSFAGGDLVGGVLSGVRMLAESAGRVRAEV